MLRVMKPGRLVLISLFGSVLLLGSSGCASGRTSRRVEAGSLRIRIVNSTVNDVVIAIMRAQTPVRLGRVESGGVREFVANRAITGSAGSLSLRAETTIMGRRFASSPQFTVDPGQLIEWTLRDGVPASSTLIIR